MVAILPLSKYQKRWGFRPSIMLDAKREGTLYLVADLQAMTSQLLKLYGGIFALVLAASLLLAFLLSGQFLRFVTNPILSLAGTARTIAEHHDYSVRATKVCGDEVGGLTDAFNQMLTQIQSQDSALQTAQHELQEQVSALQHEIGERKRAEAEQARLTAILEATPDIVMSANPSGIPFYLNRAGHEILGVGQDRDISGRKTLYLHPEWARAIIAKERLPEAIRQGSWAGETTIFGRDGKEIPVSQVLIAHKSPEGEVEYFSTVLRDMTIQRTESGTEFGINAFKQTKGANYLVFPKSLKRFENRRVIGINWDLVQTK